MVIEGDEVYWSEGEQIWRAQLDGSSEEKVADAAGSEFLVVGDYVLWRDERTHFDPLVLDENYVMLDARTGCIQALPGLGLSISFDSVADGRHVYWYSFNGLGGVSPGDPPIGTPLIRANLETGVLEEVVTPGFEASLTDDLIGQTAARLFLNVAGEIVAIDKPQ